MYVWVNGHAVGYSQDSRTLAEFRITEYVKPDDNTLAIEVYRWSDGSYLEGQDMWRISGIQRDLYLYASPTVRIRDFEVRAELDEEYRDGHLAVDVEIKGVSAGGAGTIAVDLLDAGGVSVPGVAMAGSFQVAAGAVGTMTFSADVPRPVKWTAETPHLYTLLLTHLDGEDAVREVVTARVGFRRVEIEDGGVKAGQLYVNVGYV